MSVHRLLLVALFADAGAIWAVSLTLVSLLRDRRPPPAAPALEPWPVTPAEDPWQDHAGTSSWEPLLTVDTAPEPLVPTPQPIGSPWWNRPTSALPRLESRRALHPRNLAPAAAEAPRYVELLLTRRAG